MPSYEKIDTELSNDSNIGTPDERIMKNNYEKYMTESYELFRYIFSDYVSQKENSSIKENILKIINSSNLMIN